MQANRRIIEVEFLEDKILGTFLIVSKTGNFETVYRQSFKKGERVKTIESAITSNMRLFVKEVDASKAVTANVLDDVQQHHNDTIEKLKQEHEHQITNYKGHIYSLEQQLSSSNAKNTLLEKQLLELQNQTTSTREDELDSDEEIPAGPKKKGK